MEWWKSIYTYTYIHVHLYICMYYIHIYIFVYLCTPPSMYMYVFLYILNARLPSCLHLSNCQSIYVLINLANQTHIHRIHYMIMQQTYPQDSRRGTALPHTWTCKICLHILRCRTDRSMSRLQTNPANFRQPHLWWRKQLVRRLHCSTHLHDQSDFSYSSAVHQLHMEFSDAVKKMVGFHTELCMETMEVKLWTRLLRWSTLWTRPWLLTLYHTANKTCSITP